MINTSRRILLSALLLIIAFACKRGLSQNEVLSKEQNNDWQLGPFVKVDSVNPILTPLKTTEFYCPIRKEVVKWEEKDVFNPSAVTKDGKVYLLYRAEDVVGKLHGTSRIGLAESEDGLNFKRKEKPVFYPDEDEFKKFEWEGGCEDPRIVQDENGTFYMTYSAWEGTNSYLSIASSKDLTEWTKHGPVFEEAQGGKHLEKWAKAGAIVTKLIDGNMVAQKINGKYWMYWGDTDVFLATSDDLINWTPVESSPTDTVKVTNSRYIGLKPIFGPRKNKFDSDLVEAGPAPVITDKGIWMIYNSRNAATDNDPDLPYGTYSAGQILFDINDPTKVIARSDDYFITPEKDYEINGQVNRVCFVEGLVYYKNKWFLYYGTADSKIAVAVSEEPLM
jgi:predicted GH43/DUF377 family glycosyl hydrolase